MPDAAVVCEACDGKGWIAAVTSERHVEFQRCDACEKFPGDAEAFQAIEAAVQMAVLLMAHREDKNHMTGVLELIQQFNPFPEDSSNVDPQECDHEWDAEITSQFSNEHFTAVRCKKCGVSGEQDNKTGETTWPCT